MKKNARELLTPDMGVVVKGGAALPFIPTAYDGASGVVAKRNPQATGNNNTLTPVRYDVDERPGVYLTPREQAALSVVRNAFGAGIFPRFGVVRVTLKNGKSVARAFGLDAGILNKLIKLKFIEPHQKTESAKTNPYAEFKLTQHALTFELNSDIQKWEQSQENELKIYQPPKPAAPAVPVKKPIRPRAPAAKKALANV